MDRFNSNEDVVTNYQIAQDIVVTFIDPYVNWLGNGARDGVIKAIEKELSEAYRAAFEAIEEVSAENETNPYLLTGDELERTAQHRIAGM